MLLKWLFTGIIIYALYKYLFGANALNSRNERQEEQHIHYKEKPIADEEDEYTDYEEVE